MGLGAGDKKEGDRGVRQERCYDGGEGGGWVRKDSEVPPSPQQVQYRTLSRERERERANIPKNPSC